MIINKNYKKGFIMLDNISIKTKLISLSIIISLSFVLILFIELLSINKISEIENIGTQINKLEIQQLELRKNEKDFLSRKDLKYLEKFNENIDIAPTNLGLTNDILNGKFE